VGRASVGCWIVDGWGDHGSTDVFWVWWKPNSNASALLHNEVNIRSIYLLHRGSQELHHRVVTAYYTDALKYYSSSYYNTEAPVYYTKATEYYTTTKL
jgi:hypothetical protein